MRDAGVARFLPTGTSQPCGAVTHSVARRLLEAVVRWLGYGMCLIILIDWILLRFTDVTWWGTVLAFAPRWPIGMPLLILLPLAALLRQWRLLLFQAVAAAGFLVPIMGFELSGFRHTCPVRRAETLRVLTCNVHGNHIDAARLSAVIAETDPNIVALQECPTTVVQQCFPKDEWFVAVAGALSVASRDPIQTAETVDRRPMNGWGNFALVCRIERAEGPVDFTCVHFMSVRTGLGVLREQRLGGTVEAEREFQRRRDESEIVIRMLEDRGAPKLVAGDFNMTPESAIFRADWQTFHNAFAKAGRGFGYTRLTRWHGVRIDHVLADRHWAVECCRVCDDVGSDHLPVVAELRRVSSTVDENQ